MANSFWRANGFVWVMNLLSRITDWSDKARTAQYQCRNLARLCGVSSGYLNEYCVAHFHRPPQEWMDELRMWEAFRMLCDGAPVKEVAFSLFFKQVSHFSRAFTQYHGFCPSQCAEKFAAARQLSMRRLASMFPEDSLSLNMLPPPFWMQAELALTFRMERNRRSLNGQIEVQREN